MKIVLFLSGCFERKATYSELYPAGQMRRPRSCDARNRPMGTKPGGISALRTARTCSNYAEKSLYEKYGQ
ncbi:hypothetical protein [Metabacillus sp. 84]|uniref:hypothetical protein n=1 Tax=unclassified Metabacillus TaxID=2675274 RepID=UPI003CF76E81